MSGFSRGVGRAAALVIVLALVTVGVTTLVGLGSAGSSGPLASTPYTVTFNETGLPSGSVWAVHIADVCSCGGSKTIKSNASSIEFSVGNGTYNYNVQRVTGYYVVGVAHGTFNISGASLPTFKVLFDPVFTYLVQFGETGLPGGTQWTVTVHGNGTGQLAALEDLVGHSYATTLDFMLPNGSYRYSVTPINGSFFVAHSNKGTFVVAGGSPAPLSVVWTTPTAYAVTFTEKGLPAGMNWSVRVAGWGGVHVAEILSSETPNITFYLPNGSYHYVVAEVIYFNTPTPSVGVISVTNVSQSFNVGFTPVAPGAFYPVAFQESGLASGAHWWVRVTATHTFGHSRTVSASSNSTTIFLLLQNGTYRFVVHGQRTYTVSSGGMGNFTVLGASPSVFLVGFTPIPTYTVTFSETGLPNGTNWSVYVRSESSSSTPWPIHLTLSSNNTTIIFSLPSGAYCFKFEAVPGYTITTGVASGPFTVSGGSPAPISAGFSAKS